MAGGVNFRKGMNFAAFGLREYILLSRLELIE
jgi:hypothetical protein